MLEWIFPHYRSLDKKSGQKVTLIGEGKRKETIEIKKLYKKLKEIGVEITSDGKIVLYHATSGRNLFKILADRKIKPSKYTNRRLWRNLGETEGEKLEKVYLAKRGEDIMEDISLSHSGTSYLLKVYIDVSQIGNLRIDEDAMNANFFYESLADKCGTCSYKGILNDFEVVSRKNYSLSYIDYYGNHGHYHRYNDGIDEIAEDKFNIGYNLFFDKYIEIYSKIADLIILNKRYYDLEAKKEIEKLKKILEKYSLKRVVEKYYKKYDEKILEMLTENEKSAVLFDFDPIFEMTYKQILEILKKAKNPPKIMF